MIYLLPNNNNGGFGLPSRSIPLFINPVILAFYFKSISLMLIIIWTKITSNIQRWVGNYTSRNKLNSNAFSFK